MIWTACLKIGIRPPGIPDSWDKMTEWQRALVIGYQQTFDYEQAKQQADLAKAYWG